MAKNIRVSQIEVSSYECAGIRLLGFHTDDSPTRVRQGRVNVDDVLTEQEWKQYYHSSECAGEGACTFYDR